MKAVLLSNYGDSREFKVHEIPDPDPKEGQILVEVYAATINPFDIKLASGIYKESIPLNLPVTMGGDFSGVVISESNTSDIKTGDRVFGSAINLNGSSGGWAETAAVNLKNISVIPENLSFEEAAALPLVGSSAVQAIDDNIGLKSGQKILIHGGAGGIGHIAIQLAKSHDCYVATTVSTDDVVFAKSLGANLVIDYKKDDFSKILKDYDAVFDTVGGEVTDQSLNVLRVGGALVSMVGKPDEKKATEKNITAIAQNTQNNSASLKKVAEYAASGKIKVSIEKVFPLEDIKEAIELQSIHPRGKVVLKIK